MLDIKHYPQPESGCVNIVQVTDCHLFADKQTALLGINAWQSFNAVLDDILGIAHQQHMLLATGDISQDGTVQSYRNFNQSIAKLGLPAHNLPGNHDNGDNPLNAIHIPGLHPHNAVEIGNWLLLLLNSTQVGKPSGLLPASQLQLITAALSKYPNHHILLCLHHNPVLTGCDWLDNHRLLNGPEFIKHIEDHAQIKGVLWGHVHQQMDIQHQHLKMMATPSTWIQFKPMCADFTLDTLQPGYRLLQLHSDGSISSEVRRISGQKFVPDPKALGY
ncbi:3',5'-cyclic-AMP phosphodiesterase [Paraferrimonas sp. SM1919]|uniref:3',5'-cyclic-AMP phosphodiesterase n=1 Tax=Paraferrimonas sp. SM1919 TaxID=2662263 RepID=UPI0013D3087A|nr:3',5'-cyclic-AMP phosphodiesterase [Paraferrimonas sp. SM1919]